MDYTRVYEAFISTTSALMKKESTSQYLEDFKKEKEEFLKPLSEKQIEDFENLIRLIESHYEVVYEDYCNKACCYGIKAGMEIQEILEQFKDY